MPIGRQLTKRKAEDDERDEDEPADKVQATSSGTESVGTQATQAESGPKANTSVSNRGNSGAAQLTIDPFSHRQTQPLIFKKRFSFQIPNVNFVQASTANFKRNQLPYYYFPMHLKMMYLNLAEYALLRRDNRWAAFKELFAKFKIINYKPFFTTGSSESLIAANSSFPLMEVFKGFKNVRPYYVYSNNGNSPTSVGEYMGKDNTGLFFNLMRRLYGDFTSNENHEFGAVDATRGWALRPTIVTKKNQNNSDLSGWETGWNLKAHRAGCFPVAQVGTEWTWSYKPKNGLIHQGPTATGGYYPEELEADDHDAKGGIMYQDRETNGWEPSDNSSVSHNYPNKTYYNGNISGPVDLPNSFEGYLSTVENYTYWPMGQAPNFDTPPDLFFGISPELNTDQTLVQGMTTIEVETMCVVDVERGIALSYNTANDVNQLQNFFNLNTHQSNDDTIIVGVQNHNSDLGYWEGGRTILRREIEPPNIAPTVKDIASHVKV